MYTMKPRTRIAPSPTGIAHLGTAYTALRNWALSRQAGGEFIIRIEDTDRERYVEGAVDVIMDALDWLSIDHDEGPDIGGPHAPYTQSERLDIYQEHAHNLVESGKAYYCFCTRDRLEELRKSQQAKKEIPRYDKHCRNIDISESKERINSDSYVIRLKVPESGTTVCKDAIRGDISWENSDIDDQVLLKSDGYPTYHLGVVVDDHLMGITHIIRGEEWISSSPKHILLYESFGWPLPIFAHLPIIRNKDHSKMSKRKNDVSILSHRDRGYLPETIVNFLALMGWSHPEKKEVFPLSDFVKHFSLDRVTLTAPVYDIDKLNWLNGQYIRSLSDDDLLGRLDSFIPSDCPSDLARTILPLIKERLVTLADFESLTHFFYRDINVDPSVLLIKGGTSELISKELEATKDSLSRLEIWTHGELEAAIRKIGHDNNWPPKQYFMMLRLALTGEKATPPLFETIEVLGKDTTLTRLSQN